MAKQASIELDGTIIEALYNEIKKKKKKNKKIKKKE
jgi:hypothetical protein